MSKANCFGGESKGKSGASRLGEIMASNNPSSVIGDIARRLANAINPTLQAKLQQAFKSLNAGSGASGKQSQQSGPLQTLGGMFSGYFAGNSGTKAGGNGAGSGGTSGPRRSSPARPGRPPSGFFNRLADYWGERQKSLNTFGGSKRPQYPSMLSAIFGRMSQPAKGGNSGTANNTSKNNTTSQPQDLTASFRKLLDRLTGLVKPAKSGGGSGAGGNNRSGGGNSPGGNTNGNAAFDWWRRGWGNRVPTGNSTSGGNSFFGRVKNNLSSFANRIMGGNDAKKPAWMRAARLKVIAQKRLQQASAAVKSSLTSKGKPGWHPAAHGKLLAAQRAAKQRLAQATGLQAKATNLGANAANKVAAGLATLALKIPMLAMRAAGPAAAVAGVARLPFWLAAHNDARIGSLRQRGDYNGRVAASMARYDESRANIRALSARDTAGSTDFLVQEQIKLANTLRPIQNALTNAANNVLGYGARGVTNVAAGVNEGANWFGAFAAAGEQWMNGQGFNPNKIKDQMDKDARDQVERDKKVQSRTFTNHLKGWEDSINKKQEARRNRMPKRQLPRVS